MSELKAYLCVQAREIEHKVFSCYKQTLAFKNAPEMSMAEVYLKSETDKVIAEKDKEIAQLKQKLEDVNELIKTARKMLEDAKATAYAESVDAGMENRRLKRALYKACANWADAVEK